jgi:hypothetical protein
MPDLASVLHKPADLADDNVGGWFDRIAQVLLNESQLLVGGKAHRLTEIEFYYYTSIHADPFAHRDPVQVHTGRWYFHRTRGVYRGGSFKGVDVTFGDATAFGGILFRSLETPEGEMITGPSLLVDHLLRLSGVKNVAALDGAIGARTVWDRTSPLVLQRAGERRLDRIYRSARVGLTLRSTKKDGAGLRYILRPYRHLTEPRGISKGKAHLVVALHMEGVGADELRRLTGSPRHSIERYIAEYEAGKRECNVDAYFGKDLTPAELCRLHGTISAIGRA